MLLFSGVVDSSLNSREDYKMKVGDKVVLLTPGVVKEFDEFGNVVVQWGDGTIGYYQENELQVVNQSGTKLD